jgi:hypothetical protein
MVKLLENLKANKQKSERQLLRYAWFDCQLIKVLVAAKKSGYLPSQA